uniref:Uncharacterized protein n=1 Tax=Mycena chlorophos TaxID=658473 RepID=A0ABQ0LMK0_MYCCL|nr:predicted protein [Mycena chlorophos]
MRDLADGQRGSHANAVPHTLSSRPPTPMPMPSRPLRASHTSSPHPTLDLRPVLLPEPVPPYQAGEDSKSARKHGRTRKQCTFLRRSKPSKRENTTKSARVGSEEGEERTWCLGGSALRQKWAEKRDSSVWPSFLIPNAIVSSTKSRPVPSRPHPIQTAETARRQREAMLPADSANDAPANSSSPHPTLVSPQIPLLRRRADQKTASARNQSRKWNPHTPFTPNPSPFVSRTERENATKAVSARVGWDARNPNPNTGARRCMMARKAGLTSETKRIKEYGMRGGREKMLLGEVSVLVQVRNTRAEA